MKSLERIRKGMQAFRALRAKDIQKHNLQRSPDERIHEITTG